MLRNVNGRTLDGYIIEPILSPPTSVVNTPCRPMRPSINQSDNDTDTITPQDLPQPSPPSFSTAPTTDTMDTGNDEAIAKELADAERSEIESEEQSNQQLAMLLATADNDEDAQDIIEEFQSTEGRERLLSGTPERSSKSNSTSRRSRRLGSEVDELIGSDEEERAIHESIRMNPDEVEGVTTRRGTVVGRKRKINETKTVPLARRSSRQNFIDRNRKSVIDNAIKKSARVDASSKGRRRSQRIIRNSARSTSKSSKKKKSQRESSPVKLRRSGRFQRTVRYEDESESESEEEEDEEEGDDSDSAVSDTSMRSSGSAGRDDEDEESSDSDSSYGKEEEVLEIESSDEETITRKRRSQPLANGTSRRSSRLAKIASPARPSRKSHHSAKKKKKKRTFRRRTNPNSVFEMDEPQHGLTERERKERLEALVKQSAEVAQKLNEAMAAEKASFEAREKEREEKGASEEASPGRTLKKSERDALWPTAEGKEMQPHQVDGVRWLLTLDSRGLNAILADEMGLGKTIQSIAFLASVSLLENRGPHIVIAPKNVVPHWASEFEVFYPGKFKVITHIGAGGERFDRLQSNLAKHPDFDILVTSYDLAQRDLLNKPKPENQTAWAYRRVIREMQKLEFEYAVVDEAHRLKNAESKFSIGLRNYKQAKRRLLLTGTPLSNSLQELWALMNVLNPRIFGNQAAFDEWFSAPFDTSRGGLTINEQSLIVSRLHTILRPFFRRRLRADVCPRYSSADEVLISCPQSALQKAISRHYTKCRQTRNMSANNTFMILRQIANHPYTVCGALYEERDLKKSNVLVAVSGKFLFLYYALPRLINGGHRVLIFSQFKKALDFLEDLMDMLGLKYGRLDGDTDNGARDDVVSQFNAPGSDIPVFLLTTRAGGVGLNLQTADTVVLFDSDWNPSADLQAVSRIQRIGQKRTVHIMRLVSQNSIDEAIVERGREKLRTEAVAVGAGKFNTNVDPTADNPDRQKELAAILTKFERKMEENTAFLDPESGQDTGNTNEGEFTKTKFEQWAPQLLRSDETKLPPNEREVQPLAMDISTVPDWLRPGANLRSATLALKCTWKWEIPEALQKGVMVDNERFGKLPNKRQRRQRFMLDLSNSDVDSEDGDSYKDEGLPSETSEDIFTPSDSPAPGTKRGRRPGATQPMLTTRIPPPNYPQFAPGVMNPIAPNITCQVSRPVNRILPVLQPIMPQYAPLQVHQQPTMFATVQHQPQQPLTQAVPNQKPTIFMNVHNQQRQPLTEPVSKHSLSPPTISAGPAKTTNRTNGTMPVASYKPMPMNTTPPVVNRSPHKPISIQIAPPAPVRPTVNGIIQKKANASTSTVSAKQTSVTVSPSGPTLNQISNSGMNRVGQSNVNGLSPSEQSTSVYSSPSSGRRPQFRYVAPKPGVSGSSSARPKPATPIRPAQVVQARPTKVVPEVIVIEDTDDEDESKLQRSRSSSGSRQGTMKEMREKAAKRKAMLAATKSTPTSTIKFTHKPKSKLKLKTKAKQEKSLPATGSAVDPKLINTLESFTGVKDRALLVATLEKYNMDVQMSADHILMID